MQFKIYILLFVIIIAALSVAGCTQQIFGSHIQRPLINQTATVQRADTIGLNKTPLDHWDYLVDVNGITLYYYFNDKRGIEDINCVDKKGSSIWLNATSQCYNECSEQWPVFYVDNIVVSPPLNPSDFGTIVRDDGRNQTTYLGSPLYYYRNDTKPGVMSGVGIDNHKYVEPVGKLEFRRK